MNEEFIRNLLNRATNEANRLNIFITISIVDTGGHFMALLRQENCSYFAIEASRKKAVTAGQLRLPTHVLKDISNQFPELGKSLDKNDEVVLLPGGFPLLIGGVVIGGLGIAGGNFEQDRLIGEYVIDFSNQ